MWTPTHVKITVHKARNLKVKGRSGANDSYIIINLNDEKFTTSVKTRNKIPEWNESCDMSVPNDLNDSVLRLTVHHRNLLGFDDQLGEAFIALKQLNVYERPQSRWYSLFTKEGLKKNDDDAGGKRDKGEVQVTVTFMVQSRMTSSESSSGRLERQRSLSFRSLANLVGSKLINRRSSQTDLRESPLADLTERRFPIHSMVEIHDVSRSFHHMHLSSTVDDVFDKHHVTQTTSNSTSPEIVDDEAGKVTFSTSLSDSDLSLRRQPVKKEQDLGIPSSPVTTEPVRKRPVRPRSLQTLVEESSDMKPKDALEKVNNAKNLQRSESDAQTPVYSDDYLIRANSFKRHSFIGCGETPPMVTAFQLNEINDLALMNEDRARPRPVDPDPDNGLQMKDFGGLDDYNRDELIKLVLEQQSWMKSKHQYVQDLENYIDGLLIRVLETNHTAILENPYNKQNKSKKSNKSDGKAKKKFLINLFKIWKD